MSSGNTAMTYTRNGVLFSVIGSDELTATQLEYSVKYDVNPPTLVVQVLCDMSGQTNTPSMAEKEAWDCMMWDMVGNASNQDRMNVQAYIRYVEPDKTKINDDVSIPTLTFHSPPGEPSRIFYVSTGGVSLTTGPVSTQIPRGVYIIALDNNVKCIDEKLKSKLVETYVRRTLYELRSDPEKHKTVPFEEQDLDKEQKLQALIPLVLSSADDIDTTGPLFLTTALAIVHYIIVNFDEWRGINQFYKCRNELRLRKINPKPDGNNVLIKEEGDVLFIFMPLDCAKVSLYDVLVAALHGYFFYLNTKARSDFKTKSGTRVRLTENQQNGIWRRMTSKIYKDYYPAVDLLRVGYDANDVNRIVLHRYVDTRHDVPIVKEFGRSTYNEIVQNVYEKMNALREKRLGVTRDLCLEWSNNAKETLDNNPTTFLGVYDFDSDVEMQLTQLCPSTANVSPVTKSGKPVCTEDPGPMRLPNQSGSRVLSFQKLNEEGKKASSKYRVIQYESALFSLFDNDERKLDSVAVEHAASFLKDYGFVILKGDFLDSVRLQSITRSIANKLTKLYTGASSLKTSEDINEENKLSSYIDSKSLGSFPISKGLCRLDINPLVHDDQVWRQIRSNEKLFQSYRSIVEHTPGRIDWANQSVRMEPLAPVTTFRKTGSSRPLRITWELKKDDNTPFQAMMAINDMEFPKDGGFVVAPAFHTMAESVLSSITLDDSAKRYYFNKDHIHTFPYKTNGEKLPTLIRNIVDGSDEKSSLHCALSFLPLKAGDVVLWNTNLPYSWLRSDDDTKFSLGQLYSLTSEKKKRDDIERLIEAGALPYTIKERQKAELVRKENSKPRNAREWVWLTRDEVLHSTIPKAKPGWNWAAAKDHSSSDAYNASWTYDSAEGKWNKVQRGSPFRVPASFYYKTFFYSNEDPKMSERLREFTFGTTRFSAHATEMQSTFQFPAVSNDDNDNPDDELSLLKANAVMLARDTIDVIDAVVVNEVVLDIMTRNIEEIIKDIQNASDEEEVLKQVLNIEEILRFKNLRIEEIDEAIENVRKFIALEGDVFDKIARGLSNLVKDVEDVELLSMFFDIQTAIQKRAQASIILEELKEALNYVKRIITEKGTTIELIEIRTKLIEFINRLESGSVMPERAIERTMERKRKRKGKEEEEEESVSMEEQLESEGVTRETLSAILSVMDSRMYRMTHVQNGDSKPVGQVIMEGGVYLDALQQLVMIEFRFSVGELRPRIGDSLQLLFANNVILTASLDTLPFGTKEVKLSVSSRGDVLDALWNIELDTVLEMVIKMGVKKTLKRRKKAPAPRPEVVILPPAYDALKHIGQKLSSTLGRRLFTLGRNSHKVFETTINEFVAQYPDQDSELLTDLAKARQTLEIDLKESIGDRPLNVNEKIALARINAAEYLQFLIMAGKAEGDRSTILNVLEQLISALPVGDTKMFNAVLSVYTAIANKNKMKEKDLKTASKLLKQEGRTEAALVIDKIMKEYPKRIKKKVKRRTTAVREEITLEEEEEEEKEGKSEFLEFIAFEPFKLRPLRAEPSEEIKEKFKENVRKSAFTLEKAAKLLQDGEDVVTAKRNIMELAETVKELSADVSQINGLVDEEWHIFRLSLLPNTNFSYSKEAQDKIRSVAVRETLNVGLGFLNKAISLLEPLQEPVAPPQEAQEIEMFNLLEQIAENQELAKRKEHELTKGSLSGRKRRARLLTSPEAEGGEEEVVSEREFEL